MEILPAIDLRDGQVVRLIRGDYAQQKTYSADPAAVARAFESAGAAWIHVVDLDAARLGTLGLSMGSTMAWWTAAVDTRIRVCVDICCLTDFDALIDTRGLDGHGVYYYVPRLLKHFTTAQINALIAPRAHLALAGIYDRLTPPIGLDRIDAELCRVYEAAGAAKAWRLSRYHCGHMETAAMRAEILAFLAEHL